MDITATQAIPTPELLELLDAAEPSEIIRYVTEFSLPGKDEAVALRALAMWALVEMASPTSRRYVKTLDNLIERYGSTISVTDARDRLLREYVLAGERA